MSTIDYDRAMQEVVRQDVMNAVLGQQVIADPGGGIRIVLHAADFVPEDDPGGSYEVTFQERNSGNALFGFQGGIQTVPQGKLSWRGRIVLGTANGLQYDVTGAPGAVTGRLTVLYRTETATPP